MNSNLDAVPSDFNPPVNPGCTSCEGYGTIPASTVFGNDRTQDCSCGAFDEAVREFGIGVAAELALHDIHCDTVPCPFCALEDLDA